MIKKKRKEKKQMDNIDYDQEILKHSPSWIEDDEVEEEEEDEEK